MEYTRNTNHYRSTKKNILIKQKKYKKRRRRRRNNSKKTKKKKILYINLLLNSPNKRGRVCLGPDRAPLRYTDVRVDVKYTSNTNHYRITRVNTKKKKKKKKKRICMSLLLNSPNEGGRVCLGPDRAPLQYTDVRVEVKYTSNTNYDRNRGESFHRNSVCVRGAVRRRPR